VSEQLLTILKFCLLALLYLFFLRVLWAVWSELRPARAPAPSPPAKATKQKQKRPKGEPIGQLVVVKPPEQAGVGYSLADELTVGRAPGCQVRLDDTFVSQLHARVFRREGKYLVEDLGSTNGTYLNERKVAGPMTMAAGDHLQIGSIVLELK
jgi:pSer/pThr/pTyr-binding forkhead associated (FHA) protein